MTKNRDMGVPSLAMCPQCRRVMEIKSVTPKLRGTTETIEYICPKCGATQRQTSMRAVSVESPPS